MAQAQLLYAPQCPNCARFMDALSQTSIKDAVRRVDVNTLTPAQRKHITSVPTVIDSSGTIRTGTQAFMWLKQFEGNRDLDSFCGGKGLAYSDINDDMAPATFSLPYGPFEPVP